MPPSHNSHIATLNSPICRFVVAVSVILRRPRRVSDAASSHGGYCGWTTKAKGVDCRFGKDDTLRLKTAPAPRPGLLRCLIDQSGCPHPQTIG
jgi:hypothetical protein